MKLYGEEVILVTEHEKKEIERLIHCGQNARTFRTMTTVAAGSALLFVAPIWQVSHGNLLFPIYTAIVSILAIAMWFRVKYIQDKALALCHSIEERNSKGLPQD